MPPDILSHDERGSVVELRVWSHVRFDEASEPENDEAVANLARKFGEVLGATLKNRTDATSVRYAELDARKTESGVVEIVFFCFYFTMQSAMNARQIFELVSPVVSWAITAWFKTAHGVIEADVKSWVQSGPTSGAYGPTSTRSQQTTVPVQAPAAAHGRLSERISIGVTALLIGFLTAGAAWLAFREDGSASAEEIRDLQTRVSRIEHAPSPVTQEQSVVVNTPAPTVVVSDDDREVRRYSSRY